MALSGLLMPETVSIRRADLWPCEPCVEIGLQPRDSRFQSAERIYGLANALGQGSRTMPDQFQSAERIYGLANGTIADGSILW